MSLNPCYAGANVPHPILPHAESDATLARRTAETYRCAQCGHVVRHTIPAELRFLACVHAREHEVAA